jgi:hypothetical protein
LHPAVRVEMTRHAARVPYKVAAAQGIRRDAQKIS